MLPQSTTDIIKSTVPLLETHGLDITQHFYRNLFLKHPALRHIFNQANQRDATQSRALADAVLAYANNIDNVSVLVPTVERIANKHVSIGVEAKHYPLIGESLLQAIQEVLKLPEKHPALNAWGQAYEFLADIFINAEAKVYHSNATRNGGWEGFRRFVIEKIMVETPEVKSFYLMPVDGKPVARFSAGQYVSVKYPAGTDGYEQIRQYSLSTWSRSRTEGYRITVKRELKGKASERLHQYAEGDILPLSVPCGQFIINNEAQRHVFIAAGVGITPLFSMIKEAIAKGGDESNLLFITCCRNSEHQIFENELRELAEDRLVSLKRVFELSEEGDYCGLLDKTVLDSWLTDKTADVYFCGPMSFMSSLKSLLNRIGFKDEQLHYEVFGPTTKW